MTRESVITLKYYLQVIIYPLLAGVFSRPFNSSASQ